MISLTAGRTLLMWLGELITQRGIGNGISPMIFALDRREPPQRHSGVVDQSRSGIRRDVMLFVALAVIVGIVFVQEGQRRDTGAVRQARGGAADDDRRVHLPAAAGQHGRVILVIFAASIMAFPPTIGQLLNTPAALDFAAFFSPNGWAYVVGEVFFIIIFTYFYTVTVNPVDQADNLKKYGGVSSRRSPWTPDCRVPRSIPSRLTFPGALYLGAVAALPTILISQTSANFFSAAPRS